MDEALRRAEREQDPLALAESLRRAGRPRRAWRVLADAARAGRADALTALDALDPLPDDWRALAGELLRSLGHSHDLAALVGAGDPRLERDLSRYPLLNGAIRALFDLAPGLPRLRRALDEDWMAARGMRPLPPPPDRWLALSRLHPHEVLALPGLVPGRRLHPARVDLSALVVTWLLGEDGDERAVELLEARLLAPAWVERVEAALALWKLQHGVEAPLVAGRPDLAPRAAWVPNASPALLRDELTGCLRRKVLGGSPWPGLHDGWGEPPARPLHDDWLLLVDVDHLRRLVDQLGMTPGDCVLAALGEALMAAAGDRVVRWGGDEFLVRWERDDGPSLAEAVRATVAAAPIPVRDHAGACGEARVSVSIGVARGASLGATLARAQDALDRAKRAGGDRVVVAG